MLTREQMELLQKIESLQDDGSEGYPFSQEELDLIVSSLRALQEPRPDAAAQRGKEPIQIYDETFYSEAGMTRGTYTENHKAALQAVFNARIAAPSPAKKEGENYSKSLVSWASAEVGFWKARSLSADAELKYQHQRATEAELKLEAERKDAEMLERRIRQMIGSQADDPKYYINACNQAIRALDAARSTGQGEGR